MRIMQRYVLRELLRMFGALLTVLTLALVVVGVVGEALKSGLGPQQILQILPWIVPSLMPFTIPATLLLTTCVVYGRMAGDQEVTALKAAGINVLEVLWPSFILGAFLSTATFLLTDQFVPWARAEIERVVTLSMEDIFLDVMRTRNQFEDARLGVAVIAAGVEDRKLLAPTFRYTLPNGGTAMIVARSATIKFDHRRRQIMLGFDHGHIETPSGVSLSFEHEERPVAMPPQATNPTAPRNITIQDIRNERDRLEADRNAIHDRRIIATAFHLTQGEFQGLGPDPLQTDDRASREKTRRNRVLTTEIHGRIAMACSCFFFVLLGGPFSILQGRRQFLTSFALCFFPILVIYYPCVLLTMNLSRDGMIDPAWGMWIGNAGLAGFAITILQKVLRH